MAAIQGYLLTGLTSVPPTILCAFLTPHLHPVVAGEGTVDDGEGAIDEGEGDIDEGDGGYIVGIVSGGYIDGEGGYIEGEGGYAVSLRHITSMDPGAKQYCCPVGSSILTYTQSLEQPYMLTTLLS